jgi:NADH-quinone oxidoreductase subunit J
MIGAEFLGMIMLIIYVGAVAVLFLFVVMMLNVAQQKKSVVQCREKFKTYSYRNNSQLVNIF